MLSTYVPVAQLDRASACGAEGRTFESYRAYHILNQKSPIWAFFVAIARPLVARGTKKTPIWTILSSKYFKERKYQSRRFFSMKYFLRIKSCLFGHFLLRFSSLCYWPVITKIKLVIAATNRTMPSKTMVKMMLFLRDFSLR